MLGIKQIQVRRVEPFGGGTVVVKSIPGLLSDRDIRPLLTEMAEAAGRRGCDTLSG
jgi:hypothetical protein